MSGEVARAQPGGEFLLYQGEDGGSRLEVRFESGTVWLTQRQMAELFQTTPQNITLHVRNILAEGELAEESTCKEFLQVQQEGGRSIQRKLRHHNLDMILSVGYRVRSHRGVQFRQWATQRLREYLVKGFALDDERLKQAGGGAYFEELLARIRDIRSSEKLFWRKVLDIYATSMDYDPSTEASTLFFATVQHKMHWAAHGHTAAEVIHQRADASAPNMGLTTFPGIKPRREDAEVAKNYLGAEELDALNRIVTLYLDFAELQALNRTPMYMRDWIDKLDGFLRLSGREVLEHAGKVSHQRALDKARKEFEAFRLSQAGEKSPVERDFEAAARALEEKGKGMARRGRKGGKE